MNLTKPVLIGTVVVATAAVAYILAPSNIDSTNKWSWGEDIGWMDWRDANGTNDGVVVNSDHLSGYIWCENVGWLNVGNGGGPYANTDGTNFGVNILPGGDLEGFGWEENIGWVNFDTSGNAPDQARYDSGAGRFRGYVWGENVGWINLDDSTHFVATVPGACNNDVDCYDGDECTVDTCDAGACVCEYRDRPYGDITPFGTVAVPCTAEDASTIGDTFANAADMTCAVPNGFMNPADCPCGDVAPCGECVGGICTLAHVGEACENDFDCTGDGFINTADKTAIKNAFAGFPSCADPCPESGSCP